MGQQVPAEWDKIADTVADLNTRLGLSGDTLDTVAQQYLEAGRILGEDVDVQRTSAAFNAFKIEGEDVSDAMDHLFQVSQATGIGMNDLADQAATSSAVAQQLGWSFEETTGFIGELDKAGLNSTSMMSGLSRSLANLAEDGEEPADAFNRVTGEISGFLEEGDKASAMDLASEAFGTRNATQFIQALEDGTMNMEALGEVSGMTEDSILKAGEETKTFSEQWQLFKNNVMVALEPVAERVFGGILSLMESAVEGVQNFIGGFQGEEAQGWFADLGSAVRDAWEGLKDFGQWISDNRGPISGFASVIGGMVGSFLLYRGAVMGVTAIKGAYTAAMALAATAQRGLNAAMRANPIGVIITLIGGLVAGLTWLFTQTEIGQTIWETVWDAISTTTAWVWENVLEPIFDAMVVAWDGVTAGAAWAWENILKPAWDAMAATAIWMWESVLQPTWDAILWAWEKLSDAISWAWENLIKPAWDALVAAATWMWENVLQPTWAAIQWAWEKLSNAIMWAWENIIKSAWDALVSVLTWMWENVVSPIFNWMMDLWSTLANWFMSTWNGVLKPVFDLVIAIITWLWENVAKPYFQNIWEAWVVVGNWLWNTWTDYIWPTIQRFGDRAMDLWNDYIEPALGWISDKWGDLKDTMVSLWENHIHPMLEDFGNFVQEDVVDRVTRGVEMIKDAWETVKDAFARPINWVIRRVWNDGIAKAFNNVADAVGADTKMADIPLIGDGGSAGGRNRIPGYAKGGVMGSGLKLVGEEGPELISTGPGWVATAAETQRLLSQSDHPLTPEEAAAAAGDSNTPFGIGNWLSSGLSWVVDNTPVGAAVDWVRGGLADAAETFLKPILGGVSSFVSQFGQMGELGSGLIDWGVDELMDWIRGEDSVPDVYDGEFTANPGGFNRPAGGPITSMAGPRSYIGRFGNMHYGVDIGVPIGSAIRAAFDGVIKSRRGGGLDQIVVVNHGGFDTAYMHNSAITKAVGSQVSGGDIIARSGSAGSGPHLHFELHPGGYYNPTLGVNSLFRDKGGLIYPGMNQVLNKTGKAEYVFNQQQFENLNRMAEQGGSNRMLAEQIHYHAHSAGSQYQDSHDFMMQLRRSGRSFKAVT